MAMVLNASRLRLTEAKFYGNPALNTNVNVSQGTGITLTPNPITGTGTIALTVPIAVTSGGTGFATGMGTVALANGLNSDIAIPLSPYVTITGPTLAFSVGGFTPSSDGRILTIYNTTTQVMTLVNEDAGSALANRIKTLTGANLIIGPGLESVSFTYNTVDARWVLMASGPGLPVQMTTVAVAGGLNSNIATPGSSYVRLTGPVAAFSIGGFTLPYDGRILTIYNTTAQVMTLVNEDASSAAVNRIKTLTGANVVLTGTTVTASFVYDITDLRWVYIAPPPNAGRMPVLTVAISTALTALHTFVRVNASGAARTITLPTIASIGPGKVYWVKKIDSSVNAVSIACSGADTLDGSASLPALSLYSQYQTIGIVSPDTGTDWSII
jgi:hypothetical protein